MVLLLCLPIIECESMDARRVATIDLRRLLAAGWTLRQIEDQLDLIENCQRTSGSTLPASLIAERQQPTTS